LRSRVSRVAQGVAISVWFLLRECDALSLAKPSQSRCGQRPDVQQPDPRVRGGRRALVVADRLGVSAATVYKLCARGELPHVRISNTIRIAPADLEAFIVNGQSKLGWQQVIGGGRRKLTASHSRRTMLRGSSLEAVDLPHERGASRRRFVNRRAPTWSLGFYGRWQMARPHLLLHGGFEPRAIFPFLFSVPGFFLALAGLHRSEGAQVASALRPSRWGTYLSAVASLVAIGDHVPMMIRLPISLEHPDDPKQGRTRRAARSNNPGHILAASSKGAA
jgi:excisionase family DNA binding protein